MRVVLTVVALCSLAGSAAERPRVVVLPIRASDPKLEALADSVAEQIQTELGQSHRLDVVGASDLQSILGLERQKQIMGCSDGKASCLAEMSAALGAPWVVTGSLARAGKATRVDLKLIRTADGKALWRSGKNFKDESEMFDIVTGMTKELFAELNPPVAVTSTTPPPSPQAAPAVIAQAPPSSVAPTVAESSAPSAPNAPVTPWVVGGVGLAAAIGGGVLVGLTFAQNSAYTVASYDWKGLAALSVAERERAANTNLAIGYSLIAVGAGAVIVGAVLRATQHAPVPVTVVPTTNGLSIGGSW